MLPVLAALPNSPPVGGVGAVSPDKPGPGFAALLATGADGTRGKVAESGPGTGFSLKLSGLVGKTGREALVEIARTLRNPSVLENLAAVDANPESMGGAGLGDIEALAEPPVDISLPETPGQHAPGLGHTLREDSEVLAANAGPEAAAKEPVPAQDLFAAAGGSGMSSACQEFATTANAGENRVLESGADLSGAPEFPGPAGQSGLRRQNSTRVGGDGREVPAFASSVETRMDLAANPAAGIFSSRASRKLTSGAPTDPKPASGLSISRKELGRLAGVVGNQVSSFKSVPVMTGELDNPVDLPGGERPASGLSGISEFPAVPGAEIQFDSTTVAEKSGSRTMPPEAGRFAEAFESMPGSVAAVSHREQKLPMPAAENPAAGASTAEQWMMTRPVNDPGIYAKTPPAFPTPEMQRLQDDETLNPVRPSESGENRVDAFVSRSNSPGREVQVNLFELSRNQTPVLPTEQLVAVSAKEIPLPLSFEHLLRPAVKEQQSAGSQEFSSLWNGQSSMAMVGERAPAAPGLTSATSAYPHAVTGGQIVDQVVSRVKLAGGHEETSLSLTLHPKELGEVRIELVSDKDGLRAHLHSQNQLVQEALEKHLPRLREAFETQGLKIQDLQVSCDSRRDGGAFQHGRELPFQARTRFEGRSGDEVGREWLAEPPPVVSGWSSHPGFSLHV